MFGNGIYLDGTAFGGSSCDGDLKNSLYLWSRREDIFRNTNACVS